MTGGKPNAHGRALNEWLKKNKFKKGRHVYIRRRSGIQKMGKVDIRR